MYQSATDWSSSEADVACELMETIARSGQGGWSEEWSREDGGDGRRGSGGTFYEVDK